MPLVLFRKYKAVDPLFILIVIVPTLLAVLYFSLLASDVFIAESRFVVRSPEKPAATGLGVILKSAGFSNAGEEIYAAKDYVVSRDALHDLNAGGAFERAYGNSRISIFNRFNPFGFEGSFEDLYKYYLGNESMNEGEMHVRQQAKLTASNPPITPRVVVT